MFDEQPDGDPHGECAAEIAALNQRVKDLEADNKAAWQTNNAIDRARQEEMRKRDELTEQLAECEKERESFHMNYRMKCDEETKTLHIRLAAIQHYAQQLLEALTKIAEGYFWKSMGAEEVAQRARNIANEALSLPHDTSALDALVKERDDLLEYKAMYEGLCK